MQSKRVSRKRRGGLSKLEVLFVVAALALIFQVFPSLWLGALRLFDVQRWSRGAWVVVNIVVVLVLVAVRFVPGLYDGWHERQAERKEELAKRHKQRQLQEQKELFARMKEARKRRLY